MNKNFKVKGGAQGGFTLIELIVVIVILGILAATALPKFANLGSDARIASVQAAKGALSATSAMVHGKFLIGGGNTVNVEGTDVGLRFGYPAASTALSTAAGLDDYTVTAAGATMTVVPKSAATAAKCNVKYTNATSSGTPAVVTPPNIVVTATDCS